MSTRARAGVLLVGVGFLLAGLLAGGTASAATYVARSGYASYLRHPRYLSFSADGNLAGEGLRWRHWGATYAIARGTIYERAGYPSFEQRRVRGAIKLDRLVSCNGDRYYTRATFYPYAQQLFNPGHVHLATPCDGG